MTKNLVIVESPAKARTIEKYLGPDYAVMASKGHIRDLPENPGKNRYGVDVEHDFAPEYVVDDDARELVEKIRREAGKASTVWLATDLDREGEAIAWHVAEAAHIPASKTRRVKFSEITEPAIKAAFDQWGPIDMGLVDAQQARRIVDRFIGYMLSPLLSRKVRGGLSAGRVQSVAVRLVVEREREITAFIPREYWTVEVGLTAPGGEGFTAELVRLDGRTLDQGGDLSAKAVTIGSEAEAAEHVAAIRAATFTVASIGTQERKVGSRPPFITSTLQQEASRKLGFSPKRTMKIAQDLYEGIAVDGDPTGLITYMRTDSTAMAAGAKAEARAVIAERFGEAYTVPKGKVYGKAVKGAQEAHEAIRPTSFHRDPQSLARWLKPEELKLYRLIWQRAIASQMADKRQETVAADLVAGRYGLRASATRVLFDGFTRVYSEGRDDGAADDDETGRPLPPLAQGDATPVRSADPAQHFTSPPPRFTEASLIKALEEYGIGRPSTYAPTISTITDKGYVTSVEQRLRPEPVGEIVTDLLVQHFSEFVDPRFTARMEKQLDEVASGQLDWVPVTRSFYEALLPLVEQKRKELKRADFTTEATDEVCSQGHPMVIKLGRNGRFLSCSLYPEHKETRPLPGEEPEPLVTEGVGQPCPSCGEGTLVGKRGRFGVFAGCDRYPDCTYIHRTGPPPPEQLPFTVICPGCRTGHFVARRARRTGSVFWGCSGYPTCSTTTSHEPVGALHDTDDGPVVRTATGGLCLACGAAIVLPDPVVVGAKLEGGPPDPDAIAKGKRPARGGAAGAGRSRAATGRAGARRGRATPARGATRGRRRATGGSSD